MPFELELTYHTNMQSFGRHRGPSGIPPPLPLDSSSSNIRSNAPMLSASSSNNHSLFSFGRHGNGEPQPPTADQSNASYDFLPSVNFDDLQTSIESASTEFTLTQFPSPTGAGTILDSHGMDEKMQDRPANSQAAGAASKTVAQSATNGRPGRSDSILRRPSTSNRQPGLANASGAPPDAPTAPASMRSRRQSHYPPVSNSNPAAGKAPRKSIGPGVLGDHGDAVSTTSRRRPSLIAEKSVSYGTRGSIDIPSYSGPEVTRGFNNARNMKAKSVQPPPRPGQAYLSAAETLAPEPNRLSTLAQRSPRGGGRGSTPSSASKRASMMPGGHQGSHAATGLGARTISPTDTRRAKRMSTMPTSQSLNQIMSVPPPPPVSMDVRAESRSPSMIPRRTSGTPSSARTTPDINRKSYSSGLSVASSTSYNTIRTSTGSTQPRVPQSSSASRLPAPKPTTVHNPAPPEDEEEVPPVPAIPKAYESPKTSPADTLIIEKKKSGLSNADATNIHNNSTGSISMPVHPEPTKVQRRPSARKSSFVPRTNQEAENPDASSASKKNLQPLSLPPISLGPLNIPNLGSNGPSTKTRTPPVDRHASPPPSRQIPKTPSTPMTASRSMFFSKNRYDETVELPSLRSSSSAHVAHRLTPSPLADSLSSTSSGLKDLDASHKPSISPFLSSSAPKAGFDSTFPKRSKVGGDYATMTGAVLDERIHQKPQGPRPPNTETSAPKSPTPAPTHDDPGTPATPATPATPSSMSSLRRKLSLTWKRDKSKGSTASSTEGPVPDKSASQPLPQVLPRQDSMPPPRIPVSSTVNNLSNARQVSPSAHVKSNGGYLESRRRKSSAASLGAFASHDRTKSDTWGSRKESVDSSTTLPTRDRSVMNKFLKPKASASTIRSNDSWTAELDKDDQAAEDEMRKIGSRRKETEIAARTIDALKKRASPKDRVGPHEAIRVAMLNIYERGEIVDYNDVYFCGTQGASKVVGDLHSDAPNFGYDDERGDYTIVPGDHLAYRYEVVDILGKGSFGQVVRCIDHKLGVLVAVKIIRNKKRFHQQALVEVNILQKLREWVSCNLFPELRRQSNQSRIPKTSTAW